MNNFSVYGIRFYFEFIDSYNGLEYELRIRIKNNFPLLVLKVIFKVEIQGCLKYMF
jgi:hypothetical protein